MIVMDIFRKRMYIYNKSKNELQCFVSFFSLGFVRSLKTKGSAMAWAEGPGALQPSPPKLIRWQWFLAHQSQVTSPDHSMCRIFSRWYSWTSPVRGSGTTLCHWLFPASSLGSKHCLLSRACKQFRVLPYLFNLFPSNKCAWLISLGSTSATQTKPLAGGWESALPVQYHAKPAALIEASPTPDCQNAL